MALIGVNNSLAGWGSSTVDAVGEWIAEDSRRESDGFLYAFLHAGDPPLSARFNDYPQVAVGSSSLDAVLAMYPADWDTKAAFMGHYPGHILINAGISDINTTDIGGRIAKMEQIVDAAEAMGALPWLTALTPADGGSNGTNRTKLIQLRNLGYSLLARKRNIPYLYGRASIVDPATGGWATGLGSDALHANADGAWEHGAALAREVRAAAWSYPQTPWLADANDADSALAYMVDNPLFLTGSGPPTGWTGTGVTLVPATAQEIADGIVGNWATMSTAGGISMSRTVTGFTAGNWLYVAFRWKYVHASGSPALAMRVRTLDSVAGNPKDLVDVDYTSARDAGGTVVVIQPMPAGNDRLSISFNAGGVGTLSIAQFTVCDLTLNGLESVATGL